MITGEDDFMEMTREEMEQRTKNTNELLDHLINLIEKNSERFSFEWGTGGLNGKMEIYDKEKEIGYILKFEPIEYDKNGEAINL